MLSAQSLLNHPKLHQPWQPSGLPERGRSQQAGFTELPAVSDYPQLRGHQAFNGIQMQFLNEVNELKQLAHAYVGREYDEAIDTFVAKLKAPTDDLLESLLPIYRETRFQVHQLVGRLKGYQQDSAGGQQSLSINNCIASVLHNCLDGIDLCLAGVHSRFSRSFPDLEAILHGGLASTFYKLRSDLFREFIQAFLWQNQREGKISIAEGMEVHWFNALYNRYCHDLVLPPVDDPWATINLPDELLSGFLQRAPVSVNACTILHRMVDDWSAQLTEALTVVGCSHWLTGPTSSNENTAIGIDALISRVFNPVNSLMGTATDNPLNLDAVMDLCDSESFHLKRHREKMLACITGHFYPTGTTVFAEILVFGRAKAYIGSINELFFWVFDHDQSLRPGQACDFTADRHTSLKLTHLLSIDFSSWSASTGHALLTQAMEQTDEPDEIAAFFLDRNVTTQLNAMPQPVGQTLSNQLRDKLLNCTAAFREVLCQKVCSYFVRCGIKAVSGDSLEWLIDTPLLEPVLLGLSRQRIDISRVVQGLNSWQISDWSQQFPQELLSPDSCRRLFVQAFRLHQSRVLAFLLPTGYCNGLAYIVSGCFLDERGLVSRHQEALISVFASRGELAGLKYLLSSLQRYASVLEESGLALAPLQVAIIDQRCERGFTALLKAAMYGHADCLQELLNVPGADVNVTNDAGHTPLHLAVLGGHVQCVRVLLHTSDVAVNKKTAEGMTPLNSAVLAGHLDIVRMLLAHTNTEVNESCHNGVAPLLRAVLGDHMEIMRALLAMPGIDVNARNNDGLTPLNMAARKGFTDCVRALLKVPGILVNEADSDGCSPLNIAAKFGCSDCVRLLSETPGIDVNHACSKGLTPLFYAVVFGHLGAAEAILVAKNVLVNVMHNGVSPLYYAAYSGCTDIVRALLQTPGILVNSRQAMEGSPLMIAVQKGHWQCVRLLLQVPGIEINRLDNSGWAPLHYATCGKHWGCLQALLQTTGIKVNLLTSDGDGHFALGLAAEQGDLLSLQALLVVPGIEVNKSGPSGDTALHFAACNGHTQCIEALLQVCGINPDSRNRLKQSPLDLAIRGEFRECIRLLRSAARAHRVRKRHLGDALSPPVKVARRSLDQ